MFFKKINRNSILFLTILIISLILIYSYIFYKPKTKIYILPQYEKFVDTENQNETTQQQSSQQEKSQQQQQQQSENNENNYVSEAEDIAQQETGIICGPSEERCLPGQICRNVDGIDKCINYSDLKGLGEDCGDNSDCSVGECVITGEDASLGTPGKKQCQVVGEKNSGRNNPNKQQTIQNINETNRLKRENLLKSLKKKEKRDIKLSRMNPTIQPSENNITNRNNDQYKQFLKNNNIESVIDNNGAGLSMWWKKNNKKETFTDFNFKRFQFTKEREKYLNKQNPNRNITKNCNWAWIPPLETFK